jgi:Domain of unknown function (DUF3395)
MTLRIPIIIAKNVQQMTRLAMLQSAFQSLVTWFLCGMVQETLWQLYQEKAKDLIPERDAGIKSRNDSLRLARQQQDLMKSRALARTQEEDSIQGLVIERAYYGYWVSTPVENDYCLDVTIPVQFWVNNSQLQMPAASKEGQLGFCSIDPPTRAVDQTINVSWKEWLSGFYTLDPLSRQSSSQSIRLWIRYKYKEKTYRAVFGDTDSVDLPGLQPPM